MAAIDNTLRYIAAGFQRLDGHRLDSDGLPAGVTGTVTANDVNGVGAFRMKLVKTLSITLQSGEVVVITGDDIFAGSFLFDNVQPRSFEASFAEDDFADREAYQGINYQNKNKTSFAGRDIKPFVVNDVLLIGVTRAQAQQSGALGLSMYGGVYCGRSQISIQGRQGYTERTAGDFLLTANLNTMDSYAWGETFKVDEEGYLASTVQDWTNPSPATVHRWKGLVAQSKIYVSEVPVSTDITAMSLYSLDANNRPTEITTGFTVDPTDRSINFVAPHTSTNLISWYGYQPS